MENQVGLNFLQVGTGDPSGNDPESLRQTAIEVRNAMVLSEIENSNFDENSYLTEEPDLESISEEAIHACFEDTTVAMSQTLGPVYWNFFSYYDLQKALWKRNKLKLARNLYQDVQKGICDNKPVRVQSKAAILKEFTSIYGPVDKTLRKTNSLLRRYREHKANSASEYTRFRSFCQRLVQKFGLSVVVAELKLLNDNAHMQFQEFLKYVEVNVPLYDLNPISSKTHMDWFLLPRSHPTFMKYVLRHSELEHLVEYKIPSETTYFVEGIWYSLVDCCATNPIRISEDPGQIHSSHRSHCSNRSYCSNQSHYSDPIPKSEDELRRRELNWRSFYKDIHTELARYPLGISISVLMDVFVNGKWKAMHTFLYPMTLEELVHHLPEVFATETVNNRLIVFPAFMEDITSPTVHCVFYRVWKRLTFLTKFHGGTIRPCDVTSLYERFFKSPVNIRNWGFETVEEFVEYCKYEWDLRESETVEIINLSACYGSLLKHIVRESYLNWD